MMRKLYIAVLFYSLVSFAQIIGPKVNLKETEFNFKEVIGGEIVNHDFVISNTGGDVLKISDVRASCGCTAAKPEKSELEPGESTVIKVSFNSSGRYGAQTKFVYVTTNDPDNHQLQLKITGYVSEPKSENTEKSPKIYFPESQYNFGKVDAGKVVSHTFKFYNKGKSTLDIQDIKTSCGCTAALVSSKQILPGKEGTIKVDLDTKNRSGSMSRTITINSNDPQESTKVLTIYADVTSVSK